MEYKDGCKMCASIKDISHESPAFITETENFLAALNTRLGPRFPRAAVMFKRGHITFNEHLSGSLLAEEDELEGAIRSAMYTLFGAYSVMVVHPEENNDGHRNSDLIISHFEGYKLSFSSEMLNHLNADSELDHIIDQLDLPKTKKRKPCIEHPNLFEVVIDRADRSITFPASRDLMPPLQSYKTAPKMSDEMSLAVATKLRRYIEYLQSE